MSDAEMTGRGFPFARTGFWLGASALGITIIMLPDDDDRLFSIGKAHGPAALDLIGVIILLLGWIPVAALLWSARRQFRRTGAFTAAALAVGGAIFLVLGLVCGVGSEWLPGALLLVAAQLAMLAAVGTT